MSRKRVIRSMLAMVLGLAAMLLAGPVAGVHGSDERTLEDRVLGRPASGGSAAAAPVEIDRRSTAAANPSPRSPAARPTADRDRTARTASETGDPRQTSAPPPARTMASRLADVITHVDIEDATAREALDWFRQTTDVNLIVSWNQLEQQGLSGDTPIELNMRNITAGTLLGLILEQLSPHEPIIYEITPWFVRIMTREDANRRREIRIYDVGELTHVAPNYHVEGGGLGMFSERGRDRDPFGRQGGFSERRFGADTARLTSSTIDQRDDGMASLIELIETMVEPDVWEGRGGESTIRPYRRQLIVSAPAYVHEQIGSVAVGATGQRLGGAARTPGGVRPVAHGQRRFVQVGPVSGTLESDRKVSGVRAPDLGPKPGAAGAVTSRASASD
ncbi:MAG: hypothetical protein JJU36_13605 [Phycisphaeraceae bacterium]|nr:hypothetical protein [Phycisphaeraceae bacterium]